MGLCSSTTLFGAALITNLGRVRFRCLLASTHLTGLQRPLYQEGRRNLRVAVRHGVLVSPPPPSLDCMSRHPGIELLAWKRRGETAKFDPFHCKWFALLIEKVPKGAFAEPTGFFYKLDHDWS